MLSAMRSMLSSSVDDVWIGTFVGNNALMNV